MSAVVQDNSHRGILGVGMLLSCAVVVIPLALHVDLEVAERGRDAEARQSYRRATELHPRFAGGWFELAQSQQTGDELKAALASFQTGLPLRPEAAGQQSAYGVALQTAGRVTEAT